VLILAGVSFSVIPFSVLAGDFHAETPTLFSQSPKFLSGPVYYSDVTNINPLLSTPTLGYSSAFFTMGFGYATATPEDTTVGWSIDISQLFGISLLVS
jgi:hypothetical protein